MRVVIGVLACMSFGGFSLSFANPPAASGPTPAAGPSAAQTAVPATAAVAPANPANAAPAAAPAKVDTDPYEKALLAQGYKPQMVRGQKIFCRDEPVIGSHLEHKRCGTVEQLKTLTNNAREITESAQRIQVNKSGN